MGYSYKLIDAQVDGKVSFANIPNPSVAGALHGRSQAVDRPSPLPGRCGVRHPGLVRPAGVGRLGLCRVPDGRGRSAKRLPWRWVAILQPFGYAWNG